MYNEKECEKVRVESPVEQMQYVKAEVTQETYGIVDARAQLGLKDN